MDSEFKKALEQKRRVLVQDLEKLRAELSETTARIQLREGQLKNVIELIAIETDGTRSTTDATDETVLSPRGAPFLAAVSDLFERTNRPMHYRKLADALMRQQVYVPGRDPAANLLAHMSRDARFRRFGRGIYGLQHWSPDKFGVSKKRRKSAKRGRGVA